MQSVIEYRRLNKRLRVRFEQCGPCEAAGARWDQRDANNSLEEKDLESARNSPIEPSNDASILRTVRQPLQALQGRCFDNRDQRPVYSEELRQTLDLRVSAPLQPANISTIVYANGCTGIISSRNTCEYGDPLGEKTFSVAFEGPSDQLNPHNWSLTKKWISTTIVGSTGFLIG